MAQRAERTKSDSRVRTEAQPKAEPAEDHAPILRTATEARQGEVILGRKARWIWVGTCIVLVLMLLILGPW
jgi:hypothetical protein